MADEKLNTAMLPDEDEYAYIYRICLMKDVIGTWGDVASLLNDQLGYEYTESKYRKQFQSFQKMFASNQQLFQSAMYLEDIAEKTREFNRERMKLQTEKIEYNRWLREHARDEMICDRIIDAVRAMPEMPEYKPSITMSMGLKSEADKAGILCYGDEHYGVEFEIKGLHGETLNKYSPEIFEERMDELFQATLFKILDNGLTKIKIYSLGDELDGILRVSQLMKLRYGVVESAMRYAEIMSNWLNAMTAYVDVEFHMTEGNHTELRQIGQPKGTFVDDNMSRIIKQFIKVRLENNPKFKMVENESGLIFDNVFGYNILGIHGEVKNLESAIKTFSMMYNTNIDIMFGGHLHHARAMNVGLGKDVIGIPSLIGIDAFSMKIGKTANAGATFVIVEDGKGVTEEHHIKFSH